MPPLIVTFVRATMSLILKFWTKICWTLNYFGPKIYLVLKIFGQNFLLVFKFDPKKFWPKKLNLKTEIFGHSRHIEDC